MCRRHKLRTCYRGTTLSATNLPNLEPSEHSFHAISYTVYETMDDAYVVSVTSDIAVRIRESVQDIRVETENIDGRGEIGASYL